MSFHHSCVVPPPAVMAVLTASAVPLISEHAQHILEKNLGIALLQRDCRMFQSFFILLLTIDLNIGEGQKTTHILDVGCQ